jgi:uncharacterized membrane protein
MGSEAVIVNAFLFVHLLGGSLAIAAGYAALFARKGGPVHRRAGMLFVYGMLAMGVGAAVFGLARDEPAWPGGPMVAYFVLTATRTVRRGSQPTLLVDGGLLLVALAVGAISLVPALQALTGAGGRVQGAPAVASLVNAVLLFAAAAGDARVLRHGPLTGHRRLARHLWRMCFATFSATGSFFLGQAQVIPEPLRIMPALFVLAFAPLGFLFYWLWRVRSRRDPLPTLRAPLAASRPTTPFLPVAGAGGNASSGVNPDGQEASS